MRATLFAVLAVVAGVEAQLTFYRMTVTPEATFSLFVLNSQGGVQQTEFEKQEPQHTDQGMAVNGIGLYDVDVNFTTVRGLYPSLTFNFPLQAPAQTVLARTAIPTPEERNLSALAERRPDRLRQLATRLYYVEWSSYSPFIQYFAVNSTGHAIECNPAMRVSKGPVSRDPTSSSRIVCGDTTTPMATFEPLSLGDGGLGHTEIEFAVRGPSNTHSDYLAIALDRIRMYHGMEHTTRSIYNSNETRAEEARTTTAILFLCIALGMVLWSLVTGVLLAWVVQYPVPEKCYSFSQSEEGKIKFNTLVNCIVCCVLNFVISAAGGFTGWFVMGALYFLIIVAILITSCVKRRTSNPEKARVSPADRPVPAGAAPPPAASDVEEPSPVEPAGEVQPTAPPKPVSPPMDNWLGMSSGGKFGRKQNAMLLGFLGGMLLLLLIIMLVVYTWEIKDYQIYNRHTRGVEIEVIPSLTAKAVQFMYAWEGLATDMKLHIYTKWLTEWCGKKYREGLSNSEKDAQIRDAFITEYAIDMSEYEPSDYRQYRTVNEWFIRHLAPGVRPLGGERMNLAAPPSQHHTRLVVSPADCRMLIFPTLADSRVWVKGSSFNFHELLDEREEYSREFEGGSMVIARLAPQDYHRFNSPMDVRVVDQYDVDGTYWSVNADAAKSRNYAFYNLRRILLLEYEWGGTKHLAAYVAIGATCVGSVEFTIKVGDNVPKGGELGFMQFGGSTVILLFKKGHLIPDDDILHNSKKPVETYIKVRERMGMLA